MQDIFEIIYHFISGGTYVIKTGRLLPRPKFLTTHSKLYFWHKSLYIRYS